MKSSRRFAGRARTGEAVQQPNAPVGEPLHCNSPILLAGGEDLDRGTVVTGIKPRNTRNTRKRNGKRFPCLLPCISRIPRLLLALQLRLVALCSLRSLRLNRRRILSCARMQPLVVDGWNLPTY